MASVFEPPPTWAEVVLVDEVTQRYRFNPVWLKWFVDLVGVLNASGGGSGTIQHNSLGGLQGGTTNQAYHMTSAEWTYITSFVAGTATLTITDTKILKTLTNFNNGAAAAVGTLNNAPAAGNPTKWIPIDDNGTTRYLPAW